MRIVAVVFVLVIVGCVDIAGPVSEGPVAPQETYLANPTTIEATTVRVLLPETYRDELTLSGLSGGFLTEGDVSQWEGTAGCRLTLKALTITCRDLAVALRPVEGEAEVVIQAEGNVRMAHQVRGIRSVKEGLTLLMIRNDRSLER